MPDRSSENIADRATDAILGANLLARYEPSKFLLSGARIAVRSATRPRLLAKHGLNLTAKLATIAAGKSNIDLSADRRFNDPAWEGNPVFRRLGQTYSAVAESTRALMSEVPLDPAERARVDFAAEMALSAMAPTNFLATNPAALKKAFDTGGRSLARGAKHALEDLISNGGMPSMVDSSGFKIGENIVTTPGSVVHRTDVLELIQYRPTTSSVRQLPLIIVPPQINKYYFLDLTHDRSMVQYALARGVQVFMISWKNPGPKQRDWDLDRYVKEVIAAMDVVAEITRIERVNLLGTCAGGLTAAATLGHLSEVGDDRIASATFLVTGFDLSRPSLVRTVAGEDVVAAAIRRSQRKGVLKGKELAKVFAWLRPDDLVWNYWVNNYLLGNDPAAFDILAWNNDYTNMPAGLHHDYLTMWTDNSLMGSDLLTVAGTPIDLERITTDVYVMGASTDHIIPWQSCYNGARRFGGDTKFVRSNSGHIQAQVNPPGNPKASYSVGEDLPENPDEWLEGSERIAGTWWDHWVDWLGARSGRKVRPRSRLGSATYPPLEDAPGTYVLEPAP
ncbi:MAG: PHA/PHB synthase family protein [Acidimicrobiia bacterium]